MMEALRLAIAIALPWLAGFLIMRAALRRTGRRDGWVEAGYGHFAGVLLTTLLLRGVDGLGLGLSFPIVSAALVVVAISAEWLARSRPLPPLGPAAVNEEGSRMLRFIAGFALALIAVRVGTLALEVLLRPLFPWDAWSQWTTKAKVWSELRDIVPFIGYDDWLARRPGYTDTAPHYPATIPLLQAWMALALGRWDDVLINLPWFAAFLALGMGTFGQLRRLGVGTAWAVIAAYLVMSLPLLNVHVALAGYADLHLAAVYALGVLALAEWERSRSLAALVLLAAVACLLPLLKVPGIAWFGTLALGTAIAAFGTTWRRVVALIAAALILTSAAALVLGLTKVTTAPVVQQYQIVESLVHNLFAYSSWNLLWYLLPLAFVTAWREALAYRATTITLACGFAFLAWTFLFTQAGDWVVDYTTVNRALLHIAPAGAAFAMLVVGLDRRRHAAPDAKVTSPENANLFARSEPAPPALD